MEIIIGLIIIAIGSFCQSSSYVPIKKVKEWSWESFWLIQGVFAWLVFPLLGALLGIPQGGSLFDLWGAGGAPMSIFYGILWGVGGLTFGLSMRYLGVALGQSIALGTCAGFGTLFPAIPYQALKWCLTSIKMKAGIRGRLSYHMGRHSFSTLMTLENGVPIETVSKMLGHSDIRTTQVYARVTPKKLFEDMDRYIEATKDLKLIL